MTAKERGALATIQQCVAAGRYLVLPHFVERMDERGLFWPDIESLLSSPSRVSSAGRDEWRRPKWVVAGNIDYGLVVEIVCVLDVDAAGNLVVFITAYWKD